jgi:hypothetical protein
MAVSNLGLAIATWFGGHLFDALRAPLGATSTFNTLVLIGAAFTAAGWLLVPWLRLHPPSEGAAIAE